MNEKLLVKKSKWLSKHLRHSPELIGLTLKPGGWVEVADLLDAARRAHFSLSRSELEEVVARNDKQRFSFDESGTKIRANQGHSTEVDLQLEARVPPPVLFHGTGAQNKDVLLHHGLNKMRRHHVHLSLDLETARRVGARHGKPIIFVIDAVKMSLDGIEFFCSDNEVWLVDSIPPQYLSLLDETP